MDLFCRKIILDELTAESMNWHDTNGQTILDEMKKNQKDLADSAIDCITNTLESMVTMTVTVSPYQAGKFICLQ